MLVVEVLVVVVVYFTDRLVFSGADAFVVFK